MSAQDVASDCSDRHSIEDGRDLLIIAAIVLPSATPASAPAIAAAGFDLLSIGWMQTVGVLDIGLDLKSG